MTAVERSPVRSRTLRSVGYDERSRLLEVEFLSGKVYRYEDVTKAVHEELLAADSIGA